MKNATNTGGPPALLGEGFQLRDRFLQDLLPFSKKTLYFYVEEGLVPAGRRLSRGSQFLLTPDECRECRLLLEAGVPWNEWEPHRGSIEVDEFLAERLKVQRAGR